MSTTLFGFHMRGGRSGRMPVMILAFVTLEFWYIACSDGVSSPCLMCGW